LERRRTRTHSATCGIATTAGGSGRPGCSNWIAGRAAWLLRRGRRGRANSDSRITRRQIRAIGETLDGNNHVVVSSQVHANPGPLCKVGSSGNSSSSALHGADGPELVKGSRSLDGRLVHTSAPEHLVSALAGGEASHGGPWLIGSEIAVGLYQSVRGRTRVLHD
jgi:hypothetical protein